MLTDKVYETNLKIKRFVKTDFMFKIVSPKLFKTQILPQYPDMTFKEFMFIWKAICTEIADDIATNGMGFKLPSLLGELKIQYIPYKKDTMDLVASKELGEKVPQVYLNSKGKVGALMWERESAQWINKILNIYAFEQDRNMYRHRVTEALTKTPEVFRVGKLKMTNKVKK